jgi:opacity protein-like surface antigen
MKSPPCGDYLHNNIIRNINMNKIITAAAIAAVLTSTSAVQAEESWTGFSLGANIGSSNGELSFGGSSADDDTTVYGIHAGYDKDFGKYVVGAELEYSIANYENSGVDIDTNSIRLKVRGGYDLGRTLVYGLISVVDVNLESNVAPGISVSDTGFGFGLGVSFKATENIIVGLEYINESIEILGVDADVESISLRGSYKF